MIQQLLKVVSETCQKIDTLKDERGWRTKPDTQYLVIPYVWHAMKCAETGLGLFQDAHFGPAGVLARVALEHATYARWLATVENALVLHEANIEYFRKTFGKDFVDRFEGKVEECRIAEVKSHEYGDRAPLPTKRIFDALGFEEDLFVPWRVVTQFIHPSDYFVDIFWGWSAGEETPTGIHDHKAIVWKILADAIVIALDAFAITQRDDEAKILAESLYPEVGIIPTA